MGFTTPRTWVTNEVVTSTILNTHVRDNFTAVPHPISIEATPITVSNTATETSLFTSAPTIAANTMGGYGWVRAVIWGTYGNNTTTRSMIIRVKFGGGSYIVDTLDAPSAGSATIHGYVLTVDVHNMANAALQDLYATMATDAPNVDSGFLRAGVLMLSAYSILGGINTTSDQTLDVTVQWSAADANTSWVKRKSIVTVMNA